MFGKSQPVRKVPGRRARLPRLEPLEDRKLLFAFNGNAFAFSDRITYSFVPDGTLFSSDSSSLNQAMASRGISTQSWQDQFRKAAAIWQSKAGLNLAEVSDSGDYFGVPGNQQNDSRFGDIRIGGIPLPSNTLAVAFLPPTANGGTLAGDILFNTSASWSVGGTYDILTVALHEFGHDLGLDHSSSSTAVMYATYNGVKSTTTTDDINGVASLLGARVPDSFDTAPASNNNYLMAANVTGLIDSNYQVRLGDLDITSNIDNDWFKVQVPAGTTGTMQVTMQSTALSSLSPMVAVYSSGLLIQGHASSAAYGATLTVTLTNVSAGQVYYIRALSSGGSGYTGHYGLGINFGATPLEPFAPPDTTVLETWSTGSSSAGMSADTRVGARGWQNAPAGLADSLAVDARWARGIAPGTLGDIFGSVFGGPLGNAVLGWLDSGSWVIQTGGSSSSGSAASTQINTAYLSLIDWINAV